MLRSDSESGDDNGIRELRNPENIKYNMPRGRVEFPKGPPQGALRRNRNQLLAQPSQKLTKKRGSPGDRRKGWRG
eukprot:4712091-Alexandrium_andersonii.AAC.1